MDRKEEMENNLFDSDTRLIQLNSIKMEKINEYDGKLLEINSDSIEIKPEDPVDALKENIDTEIKSEWFDDASQKSISDITKAEIECDDNDVKWKSFNEDEVEHLEVLSPAKKRLKKNHLSVKMKEGILNAFKNEMRENQEIPVSEIVLKVAEKFGVNSTSVFEVVREYKGNRSFSEPKTNENRTTTVKKLDDADKHAIRRKVHEFFFRNEVPSTEKVFKEVSDDDLLPNFKRITFYKVLKSLNFKRQKLGRNSLLMDREEIIMWRRDYLTKIKEYRKENRPIYYLDETWVDETVTCPRIKNPSGKRKRLIVCHIGNEKGFVDGAFWCFESKKKGDYYEEMNGELFEKWFSNILSCLEVNSVIVLDNAPYHCRRFENIPTSSSKKCDVQNWLRSKDIHFDDSVLKVQLLAIVKQHKANYQKYIVDEIAASQNKTVLRLPPYHCELNPIESIWADAKNFIAQRNTSFKFADLKNLFNEALQNITAEKWEKCVQHVIEKVEVQMWELDNIIEAQVESLIMNLTDDDNTDDDEESSSS